jgi:hypothetical protein
LLLTTALTATYISFLQIMLVVLWPRNPLNNMANPLPTFQAATGNCGGNYLQCLETNAGQGVSFQIPNYHPVEYLGSPLSVERALPAGTRSRLHTPVLEPTARPTATTSTTSVQMPRPSAIRCVEETD